VSGKRARSPFKPLCLIALLFSAGGFTASGGKNDAVPASTPSVENPWSITVPASAEAGDCLVVRIESGSALADAEVILRGGTGEIVLRAVPFEAAERSGSASEGPFRLVALIPLASTLESGTYSVETAALLDGRAVNLVTRIVLEEKNFFSEEIALDPSNTAIKNDTSPQRLAQMDLLNELLNRRNPDAPRFAGPFVNPLGSARRTSQFGDRRVYRYSNGRRETAVHWGVDFGVPTGTPVFASGDGRVLMAEKRISTGWTVVIEHLPGVYSLYYHLDALLTAAGEDVRAGTLIARSGNTGLSTGAHLHWEFRVNGVPVSPDWFAGRILF